MIETEKPNKPLLLVFPFNVLSHYLRCLKLARYLVDFFEIRFLGSEKYSSFISEEDYGTFSCATLDEARVVDCVSRFDFSWLNKNDLEPVYIEQAEVIKSLRPQAVLGDMSPTLKMAAETAGIQYIALMNGYMSRYYAQVREMPYGHPLYKFMKRVPHGIAERFIQMGEQLSLKEIHKDFKLLRRQYNLSKLDSYPEEMEGDINLICDLPTLFPQKRLPQNYYFVPPLFYTKGRSSREIVDKLDKTQKTIYVSMGSTGNWNNVAFLNAPFFKQYNIVTAGDNHNVVRTEGVIKTAFINAHDLFPHIDLVICHGGNGTMYQALFYGVPLLYKTVHLEQQWNVRMLESLGVGKSLDKIDEPRDYALCVQECIDKKNNPELLLLQKEIWAADNNFEGLIGNIVKDLFLETPVKLVQSA